MSQTIHLISDLHLFESQPHLFKLFEHYMAEMAPQSEQLYVLGDLFEVWVGDDNDTLFNQSVMELFLNYSKTGRPLYFCHGNRDFLLGNDFARACGGEIIKEPCQLAWHDKKITLMHGDSLCTDDTEYQQFRTMVRSTQWQEQFLSQPLDARITFAENARAQSQNSQQQKASEIMDVNLQAVVDCIQSQDCDWLIHGHTHREGHHEISWDGKTSLRIVLSDWGQQGHYLELKDGYFSSNYFTL